MSESGVVETETETEVDVGEADEMDIEFHQPGKHVSTIDLLQELRRHANELGEMPTQTQIMLYNAYSASSYANRFGSLRVAARLVGYPHEQRSRGEKTLERQTVMDELSAVADELGHPPTTREFEHHSSHNHTYVYRRFDSWGEALAQSGLLEDPEDWDYWRSRRRKELD